MKKAKRQGLPLALVLKFAAQAYVEGRLNVGIQEPERFNAKTRKEIKESLEDIKRGRNLSPEFGNADGAIAYLESRQ